MLNSDALRPPQNSGRKALGKLATRLEEVKNPWRQGSTLELSHNEAARLATDALLESGEKEYKRVLSEERELNFLSPLEIRYITENVAKNSSSDSSSSNGNDFGEDTVSEMTSGTYFPMMSDEEPPMLELGWPENPPRYGPSETQIYFQRDKSHNVKDLIRSLISKAKKVIALVMDLFTDVDLLCDLMEAANKRRVPVYILLDEKSAGYFVEMCRNLDIQNSHLGHMRVRSVCGDTYCTKSGKKFTGQVKEKFLIIDCEEVIAGSYSFSWLSAQVHSNMVMHFSGRIVDSFDREFRCLYADSQIVDYFHNPDEEDLPTYPSYPSMVLPGLGHGLDLLPDRQRERVCSDNSSSQSSNSMSSVKAAPRMNTVYKVSQGHDRKESHNPHPNGRRGSGAEERERLREERERDRLTPTPQNPAPVGPRGASNGVTHHAPVPERPTPSYGQQAGAEWSKSNADDFHRPGLAGATSKFQAFGIYDHKPGPYPSPGPGPVSSSIPGPKPTSPVGDPGKPGSKSRAPSNPLLNKLTDLFLLPSSKDKEREPYVFKRSPPHSQSPAAWGGPDLSLSEPESKQNPPPPPTAGVLMNRHDQKRMTLGHSKLDLVNHYNKMKPKHAYSRFELKNNNFG